MLSGRQKGRVGGGMSVAPDGRVESAAQSGSLSSIELIPPPKEDSLGI